MFDSAANPRERPAEPRWQEPKSGQRWISDSEPELGLGIILQSGSGRVSIFFTAANEHRQYALDSAPLRRVKFQEGDRIKIHTGANLVVESVDDQDGLLTYRTARGDFPEAQLSDTISFTTPQERLLGGQIDEPALYSLRIEGLQQRSRLRRSEVRGFVGGRIGLIPHQLAIASEVASRLAPRVLLADEVGLGKTIESGLILHRLHLTGRAERVLILVPESLTHQWFVELWRRFNLGFSLFDEDRCRSIERLDSDTNPFLDSQLVLCSIDFLASNPVRAKQAVTAGWDLLVVDEAHHLAWSEGSSSPEYEVVTSLAKGTPGLLLLTATPEQLGPDGHFARLHLLDPERYPDLALFRRETEQYEQVAAAIEDLMAGKPLTERDRERFGAKSELLRNRLLALDSGEAKARQRLIEDLLDQFGVGRVIFRNTRKTVTGFPKRESHLTPLKADSGPWISQIKWLVRLLKRLKEAKVLLICHTQSAAEEVHQQLQAELNVKCALFHEGLSLLQRDRQAAFFAENDGARILICSEIGSEGRNFQFAHHLVLFDLPKDPELLEQRIGRLDRIGQSSIVHIHVPYLEKTESEVLARWYEEGLDAFQKNLPGGSILASSLKDPLEELCQSFDGEKLEAFLERSKKERNRIKRRLSHGYDRLLELNQPGNASELIRKIRIADEDRGFREFFLRVMEHFGVQIEDLGHASYLLRPSDGLNEALPSLPTSGLTVCFDRTHALSREDQTFLTGDHPLGRGALDLLLGSESGNAAYAVWKEAGKEAVLLEVYAVVECVAPASLHVDRFLSPTPIRIVVDHLFADQTANEALATATLEKSDLFGLLDRGVVRRKLIPGMLKKAQEIGSERVERLIEGARSSMQTQLQDEIDRLVSLRKINDHVRPEEIVALQQRAADLGEAIGTAHLRFDSVRLILAQR